MSPSFEDFDIEIQDEKQSNPEHFNGNVTTAGVPVTLSLTSAVEIQWAYIECAGTRDPDNKNNINDSIKYSLDGTNYIPLMAGESAFVPGIVSEIKLDTNTNGTYYYVILWG